MTVIVEPLHGSDLERLVTALLNATGCLHTMIEAELDAGVTGLEVIDRVGEAARRLLAPVAEHFGDDQLSVAMRVVAEAAIALAEDMGMGHVFQQE
jgi:hypothetical protein